MTTADRLISQWIYRVRGREQLFCDLPSISVTRASISLTKCSGSSFSASCSFVFSFSIMRSSLRISKALAASLGSSWSPPKSRPKGLPVPPSLESSARTNPDRAASKRKRHHMFYVYSRGWSSDCPARVCHSHLRFIYQLTPPPARPPFPSDRHLELRARWHCLSVTRTNGQRLCIVSEAEASLHEDVREQERRVLCMVLSSFERRKSQMKAIDDASYYDQLTLELAMMLKATDRVTLDWLGAISRVPQQQPSLWEAFHMMRGLLLAFWHPLSALTQSLFHKHCWKFTVFIYFKFLGNIDWFE